MHCPEHSLRCSNLPLHYSNPSLHYSSPPLRSPNPSLRDLVRLVRCPDASVHCGGASPCCPVPNTRAYRTSTRDVHLHVLCPAPRVDGLDAPFPGIDCRCAADRPASRGSSATKVGPSVCA